MTFTLSSGAYTPADAARVLEVKPQQIANLAWRHWWGAGYAELGEVRSLDFLTLMELKTYLALREAGVTGKQIHGARRELIEDFGRAHPFAQEAVLSTLRTDGNTIYWTIEDATISLNGTKQFNLALIQDFIRHIDFGDDGLAARFSPPRGNGSVVLDPRVQLGHPVIRGSRVEVDIIAQMHRAGDDAALIAEVYGLSIEDVEHAIRYAMAA